ncbi:MAG: type I methionyl aminopeptidase [Candidatus Omnitrophica bacterium]|nr:type I methionyl aminopeptidase [Candidatus Omnitrophota bacterium]MCM8811243.1 type I methionyl aminopeptidase [Candidatus Omnitrophota bacterium]
MTKKEIDMVRTCCKKAREIIEELKEYLVEGISTYEIDLKSIELMKKKNVESAFKGYRGYPANICISVNFEVIHGLPKKGKILKNGDIVSLDVGVKYNNFYGDCADTFPVGKIDVKYIKLIKVARKAFEKALKEVYAGSKTGNIGYVIENYAQKNGFSVIKEFAGHGIGKNLHQTPEIPNFGYKGEGDTLHENEIIAIEPMVAEGEGETEVLEDGWTVVTKDRKYSAHYENCVLIKKNGYEVLS